MFCFQFNWKAFDEPVVQGLVAPDDEWGQYRHALPTLKRSLSTIYLRPEHDPDDTFNAPLLQKVSQFLELPLYPRYVFVAAYIASYNPKSADKRFLVKVNCLIWLQIKVYVRSKLLVCGCRGDLFPWIDVQTQ